MKIHTPAALVRAAFSLLLLFNVNPALTQSTEKPGDVPTKSGITWGTSYKNDVSAPLRDMPAWPVFAKKAEHEANPNPLMLIDHVDVADPVIQNARVSALALLEPNIPAPIITFEGIDSPGVVCNCSPPDTNGAVGTTQYVQMVNEGLQVWNKVTGASVFGPVAISAIWTGFSGVCETGNSGDPIVLFDHFANRWMISQFRLGTGFSVPTDMCIAVSTSADATGTWNRYGFHLGSNFFDYPHAGVWPDAYYFAFNIFNSTGSARLGPQAFAFDRAKMIAGIPATFVAGPLGASSDTYYLPADIDGPTLPPAGAACPFVSFPSGGTYKVNRFHVDFVTPANSTFTLFASPPAAGFTQLCPGTRSCVPTPAGAGNVDGIGDRLMFRLPYRNFGDHEAIVGNMSVNAAGVAGIRWFEMRNITSGVPTIFQESTYSPDTLWRWMGSIAMDGTGNLAVGFSAANSTNNPSIRYAGRLISDPINTLAQGEATLIAGGGAPSGSGNRWGDYSALTVDPVDDATFWYTQEYFSANGTQFTWKTRIGSFKFGPVVPTNVLASGGSMIISAGGNGVLDPGETVTVSLGVQNAGGPGVVCTTAATTGTLQASGGVTSPSAPQNYGVMCSPPVTTSRNFTFTVDPMVACGATVTASLQMQDGATNYGTITYPFVTGTSAVAIAQNFDGVVAPVLPAGWTSSATGIGMAWVTSTVTPNSAPNDAFAPDPSNVGDSMLLSPTFAVPAGGATLTFRNNFITESTFDGVVLEVSINGGAFADITSGGNAFIAGGYTGPISTSFASPIAGRQAWNGNSGGYITSTIKLPVAANGQNAQLKWRMATDNSVSATGVRIDDISISNPVCNMIPQCISGVKCVGTGGDYPTLTAAVNDLNSKMLCGPLTLLLIDSSYTTGPQAMGETFPIVVEQNAGSSGTNTVTIKPGPPVSTDSSANPSAGPACLNPTPVSITGSNATALIVLNGASWISIDGSSVPDGSDRSLTLTNTNPGASSAVVWLQTTTPGAIAATNNTVKNVNLVGNSNTTTLFGAGSGSSDISTTSLGTGNNNNTFQNNSISRTQYGIYSQGASAANKNTGTVITQNVINAASPNNVQIGGIMVGFENNIAITQNVVSGMSRSLSAFGIGVGFVSSSFSSSVFTGNEVTNATISRNNIGAVTSSGSFSAMGIALASAAFGTSQISNNFVSGVTANSTSSNFSAGILVGGGAGSTTQLYYNSVSMTGARGAASTASYAMAVGGSNPVLDARDNILFNSQTSTSGGKSYAIGLAYSTYSNLISDYNDLFASGTQAVLAVVGSLVPGGGLDLDTLSAWQAATGKDAHSISANPLFLSATNLHITPISPAADEGTPIAAITNDIDGNPRSLTAPDIGADESTLKILSIARAGNGHIILQCLGVPNQVNNLQASPDLSPMSFMTLIPAPPAADGLGAFQYDDAGAVGLTKRFYHLSFP